jgi:hypothetical protein
MVNFSRKRRGKQGAGGQNLWPASAANSGPQADCGKGPGEVLAALFSAEATVLLDANPDGVGRLAVHRQHEVKFAAPYECARESDVDLV